MDVRLMQGRAKLFPNLSKQDPVILMSIIKVTYRVYFTQAT